MSPGCPGDGAGGRLGRRELRHVKAIALNPPPPPPSDSDSTPASITPADMLANVGIPRQHQDYLSRGRIESVRDKVAAFAEPSWRDRLVRA